MKKNICIILILLSLMIYTFCNKSIVSADESAANYNIDNNKNIISRVASSTKVSEFFQNITLTGNLKVVDSEGNELSENDIVKTGHILQVVSEPNIEYVISVIGDVIKTGNPSIQDGKKIAKHIIDKNVLNKDEELLSADFNNDQAIKMNDVMNLIYLINNPAEPVIIDVNGITLNQTEKVMIPGEEYQLTATINPSSIPNTNINWTSSNNNVVTVSSEGKITAIDKGEATITATIGNVSATCQVLVHHNILLVGNSKTYRTSITNQRVSMQFARLGYDGGYLDNLVTSSDIKIANSDSNIFIGVGDEITVLTENSTSLKEKADSTTFNRYISNKKYDIVILQEKTANVEDIDSFRTGIASIYNLLSDFNGKLYIRMIWPEKNTTNYEESINLFKTNTETLANEFNAKVIYDGLAFKSALENNIEVYDVTNNDYNHQSYVGAYLSALCMYRTVFNGDPREITDNIYVENETTANTLKEIAYNVCN